MLQGTMNMGTDPKNLPIEHYSKPLRWKSPFIQTGSLSFTVVSKCGKTSFNSKRVFCQNITNTTGSLSSLLGRDFNNLEVLIPFLENVDMVSHLFQMNMNLLERKRNNVAVTSRDFYFNLDYMIVSHIHFTQ